MNRLNKFMLGAIVGIIIGMWFGVNLGKGKPFWTNPFGAGSVTEIAKNKTKKIVKEGKQVLREQLKEEP